MQLTREQAITEHRKMWNWIADEIEHLKYALNISSLKREYCTNNGIYAIRNYCFCCEYTDEKFGNLKCEKCPINWGITSCFRGIPCEGDSLSDSQKDWGLWWKCYKSENWQEQAALARQIANLPERTDVRWMMTNFCCF